MVWLIAGGAGGEVWGRLDEAAARELRRRGRRRVHSLDFQAGFSGWRDRRLYPLKRVADEFGGGREWCRRRWFG